MASNRYCAFGGRVLVPRELRPGHWYIVGLPGRGMRRGMYVASRWGWRATRDAAQEMLDAVARNMGLRPINGGRA